MANPTIEIFANTTPAKAMFAGVAAKAGDVRPAMQTIKGLITLGHREIWETRGASIGRIWPNNAPGTLARKTREGEPPRPLEASGALKTAIYGGKGRYSRVSKSSVRVGVRLHYARYQLGDSSRLPRRQMVGISRATERAAMAVLRRYLAL